MVNFIVSRIERVARISLADGQVMYRAYMIDVSTYAKWKAGVDAALSADGFADVIVEE